MMKIITFLALISGASAACPNSCSGHGTCGADDVCTCYQGWGMGDENSGDCSEQFCPHEFAFVDTPDGAGTFHKYMECAGKGLCDRSTGECECFEGFAGKGCQRSTCPNDCSGHGTCEYIEELTFGANWGEYYSYMDPVPRILSSLQMPLEIGVKSKAFADEASKLWDYHKSMACVCDGGYTDVDCSRRMCLKGNDVMDERMNLEDKVVHQTQNITLFAAGTSGNGTNSKISDFEGKSFAITFTSLLNESYTTIPIYIQPMNTVTNITHDIGLALKSLPNKVCNNVNVNASFGYEEEPAAISRTSTTYRQAYLNIEVTFTGTAVQGKQNLLTIEAKRCMEGCTPQITGLDLISVTDSSVNSPEMTLLYGSRQYLTQNDVDWENTLSFVSEKFTSDYNNYECGRRGKCDYDSGICECFEGYTGEGCSIQTALV